ncbi:hypothetical protein ON064_03015 [Planococcus sp. A6]|uniref:hypothetical protein n=1 Tax=Planococcus sp. A6 TaxID=2992760 RepID=UPI00237AC086|nr:hypothetical protein [Planococcus sp. A6]MDE0582015.1 hypothetical protein [Planococcus sp. A6]
MRRRDFFLTFETESHEEFNRILDLYLKMEEAIGNPDRIAFGMEHEKIDLRNEANEITGFELTGKTIIRIDIYKDELIERKKK